MFLLVAAGRAADLPDPVPAGQPTDVEALAEMLPDETNGLPAVAKEEVAESSGETMRPEVILPLNGAESVGLTPRLQMAPLPPAYLNATSSVVRWQIVSTRQFSKPVWDAEFAVDDGMQVRVPSNVLEHDRQYYCRVRYDDKSGQPHSRSPWSRPHEFNTVTATSRVLECRQVLSNLHGCAESERYFLLNLPPGRISLKVEMGEGEGDADLYVRRAQRPTLEAYDIRPYVSENEENVLIEQPEAGAWHILVAGYDAYTGVWLSVSCTDSNPVAQAGETQPYRDLELSLYYELSGFSRTDEVWSSELRGQLLRQEGRAAYNAGNYTNAIAIWSRWSDLEPFNEEPVSLVGDVHLREGDLTNAIACYRKSLALNPGQIGLAMRFARLLDTEADLGIEARDLLNLYARLFPNHPDVTLAQAEWLTRHKRYDEAGTLIRRVIEVYPDDLRALTLLHGLLRTPEERYANFQAILEVGNRPGMETHLAQAIRDYNLLTRPESWMLMSFLERMAREAPNDTQRDLFARLLPRDSIAMEDFRIGRMSRNWISSADEHHEESGSLILSAEDTQTEAFLRLVGSDAMQNGFVEALVENTRGFFWLYARRGEGNMVRFGFDATGRLYLQLWINGQLLINESRLWSRAPGPVRLRLELRGDGAFGFLDDKPAFGAPISIPRDMGLGWWGIAPWSPRLGEALVEVRQVAGGPLPVRIGLLTGPGDGTEPAMLKELLHELSAVAPNWYTQQPDGSLRRSVRRDFQELRLLCRYYRSRLLPAVQLDQPARLRMPQLIETAARDRLDGFVLLVKKIPDAAWFARAEEALLGTSLTLEVIQLDDSGKRAQVREICPYVGLFPGVRRVRSLPVLPGPEGLETGAGDGPMDLTARSAIVLIQDNRNPEDPAWNTLPDE